MDKINIIIPAFNEVKRLPVTLAALGKFLEPKLEHDIHLYLIDDGSKDGTGRIAQELIEQLHLPGTVLEYGENRGKGYAVKFGMQHSRPASYYYLADADFSSPWEVLNQLLDEMQDLPGEYAAVIGSRALASSQIKTSESRYVSGRLSNMLINLVLHLGLKDTQCGYKLFDQRCLKAFELQTIDRWGFDFEILYLLKRLGLKIKEVGIVWENREGSKVKFSDYFKTFKQLWQVRTTHYPIS